MTVDIDRFIAYNNPMWTRLGDLLRRANRKASRLSSYEIQEVVVLTDKVSAHLSYANANFADANLTGSLTQLVGDSSALIYGARVRSLRSSWKWLVFSFPASVWRIRKFILVSTLLTFLPAIILGLWIANSPRALDASAPAAVRDAYVTSEFEDYYSNEPAAAFAAKVYTNNVRVAGLAFVLGITFGIGTVYVLISNGALLGMVSGLFANYGQLGKMFGLIIPHGLVELMSVVIAGGAGLSLGWTLMFPGNRKRAKALADEAQRSLSVIIGVALTLAIAGLIEGFVTGHVGVVWIRVSIGVVAWLITLYWLFYLGRIGHKLGYGGRAAEADQPKFLAA